MANWVAMYLAASSLPRRPGPRPSRRSSARNRTWARIFSGSTEASAAWTAGGIAWAFVGVEELNTRARSDAERRVAERWREVKIRTPERPWGIGAGGPV